MKYLDEDIEITVSGFTIQDTGIYTFEILSTHNTTDSVVFVGNCFLSAGETSHTFYVNDILNNLRSGFESAFSPIQSYTFNTIELCNKITVRLTIGANAYSSSEYVMLANRYPNRKDYLEHDIKFNRDMTDKAFNFLQGSLLPHIPYMDTNNYMYLNSMQFKSVGINPIEHYYSFEGSLTTPDIEANSNGRQPTLHKYTLHNLFGNATYTQGDQATLTFNLQLYDEPVVGPNMLTDPSTECDSEGDVMVISNTNYDIGQSTGKLEVYAGRFEQLATTIENIPSKTHWSFEIPSIDWSELQEDGMLTLYFSYGSIHAGVVYVYSPEYFTGLTGKMQMSFDVDEDTQYYTYRIYNVNIANIETDVQREKLYDAAVVDFCPARYYLMWQDRLGGYQSQPFDLIDTFSESFSYNSIINYKHEKSHSCIDIVPKWNLNTGFISSELYPYYESIFTSPQLLLYDTREDKSYVVNVTDTNYTEKTFKNQSRKMFNLTLNVELNKAQVIYQ